MNSIPYHLTKDQPNNYLLAGQIFPKMDCKSTHFHYKTIIWLKKKYFYSKV